MTEAKGKGRGTTGRLCPLCDVELEEVEQPFCQACQVTIVHCHHCDAALERGKAVCPQCGEPVAEHKA
ncbi:MAG TPA: hypothetical protein G4O03_01475 [Dehalococcoidia bacterium]|nr:hypothetical protein [Dehalococcoidia bacterium]